MNMKIFFTLICLLSVIAHAEDPKTYFTTFDSKVYSLKTKGMKDFVVDIENPGLKNRLNEQGTFGKVDKFFFRVFWTSSPERVGVEVMGLPEGFREVKDELKAGILLSLDYLLPLSVQDKFKGYKIFAGQSPKEFVAQDQSGVAPISGYVLKFDANDTLAEVVGKKHVGSFRMTNDWEKTGFSDGKWVIKEQVITTEENGSTVTSTKEFEYDEEQGIGVLEEVSVETVQKWEKADMKPVKIEEKLLFKNYKLNSGEALKYFLGDSAKK